MQKGYLLPIQNFFDKKSGFPFLLDQCLGAGRSGLSFLRILVFEVVMCKVTNFYFDFAYNKDPQEPGLYWGGFNKK
ncbi:MAG: hypothetical protein CM1200mP10_22990 [Candidatus Neomarinimicrobiota bacterium]|nr:MAG: hypothetical protein CM1200mP10_22990 [Candidatus Neomarinimicrobiota bacterium]